MHNTDKNEAIKRKTLQDATLTLSIFWIGSLIQFYFGWGRLICSIVLLVTNKETRPQYMNKLRNIVVGKCLSDL